MKDLQLVIFDMDGLLFDTERPSFVAMKKVMEKREYKFPLETYKRLVGMSDLESEGILKEVYGEDFSIHLILKEYQHVYREIVNKDGIMIKSGAEKLLDVLDQIGLKRCIASSSSRETIQKYLAISGLTNRFNFYVSGEEVERGKPHPDIFLEACKRGNETPASALVLEDSLHGLRAANKANIPCIMVPDLIDSNDEMKDSAHHIVSDLEQVIDLIRF